MDPLELSIVDAFATRFSVKRGPGRRRRAASYCVVERPFLRLRPRLERVMCSERAADGRTAPEPRETRT